jgi:hypothetical protein
MPITSLSNNTNPQGAARTIAWCLHRRSRHRFDRVLGGHVERKTFGWSSVCFTWHNAVLILNSSSSSLFQSLCVLGYCICPLGQLILIVLNLELTQKSSVGSYYFYVCASALHQSSYCSRSMGLVRLGYVKRTVNSPTVS